MEAKGQQCCFLCLESVKEKGNNGGQREEEDVEVVKNFLELTMQLGGNKGALELEEAKGEMGSCSGCWDKMRKAVEKKSQVNWVEERVRRKQRELLEELKILRRSMTRLKHSLEEIVEVVGEKQGEAGGIKVGDACKQAILNGLGTLYQFQNKLDRKLCSDTVQNRVSPEMNEGPLLDAVIKAEVEEEEDEYDGEEAEHWEGDADNNSLPRSASEDEFIPEDDQSMSEPEEEEEYLPPTKSRRSSTRKITKYSENSTAEDPLEVGDAKKRVYKKRITLDGKPIYAYPRGQCPKCQKWIDKGYVAKHLTRVHNLTEPEVKELLPLIPIMGTRLPDDIKSLLPVKGKRARYQKPKTKCPFCAHVIDKPYLQEHIERRHKKEKLKCPQCDMRFSGRLALNRHLRRFKEHQSHSKSEAEKEEEKEDGQSENNCSPGSPGVSEAEKQFEEDPSMRDLEPENNTEKDSQSLETGNDIDSGTATAEPEMDAVVGERKYAYPRGQCPKCEKWIDRGYVAKHLKRVHNLTEPEIKELLPLIPTKGRRAPEVHSKKKCPHCHVMIDRDYLAEHIERRHSSGETEQSKCLTCDSSFPGRLALRRHRRYCKGANSQTKSIRDKLPFKCEYCSLGFQTELKAYLHSTKLHEADLDKPCKYCGRILRGKSVFNHILSHCPKNPRNTKRTICDQCGTSMANVFHLKKHLRLYCPVAVKVKGNHKCMVCGKSGIVSKANLLLHLQRHRQAGKGEYVCDKCGRDFDSKQIFGRHRKRCDGSKKPRRPRSNRLQPLTGPVTGPLEEKPELDSEASAEKQCAGMLESL